MLFYANSWLINQIFTETDSMAGNERIGNIPYMTISTDFSTDTTEFSTSSIEGK